MNNLEQLQYERRTLFQLDVKLEEALRATIELNFSDSVRTSLWSLRNEIKIRIESVNKQIKKEEKERGNPETDQG